MLVTVYDEPPNYTTTPSGWFQVKNATGGGPQNVSLDLDSASGLYHWRGVYDNLWLDPFQSAPGFGYLAMLAVAFNGGHSSDPHCIIGTKAYDLRGAKFSCEIRANAGGGGLRLGKWVRLFFWMQFRDPYAQMGEGRYVNLSYLAEPVDHLLGFTAPFERAAQETKTSDFIPFEVTFDPEKLTDWIHMGSAANKTDIYDTNLTHVPTNLRCFEYWDWDCGFIAAFGPNVPSGGDYPFGHLNYRKLKLEVDPVLNGL